MTAPSRSEIDGIPALHLPGDAITTGTLTFRAGLVDEAFPTMGVAHLVEHLVMSRVRRSTILINAFVDPEETAFFARGRAADVGRFLTDVCTAICELAEEVDTRDIEREIGVLAAEDSQGDPSGVPLTEIFGVRGPGLIPFSPPGLKGLGPEHVVRWVRDLLVDGNAVLSIRGPWPEALTVSLPVGPRNERLLPPRMTSGNSWPRQVVVDDIRFAVLGWERPVVAGGSLLDHVVAERLTEHLRHTLGRSYGVRTERVLLGTSTGYVSLVLDAARSQGREVAADAVRELVRLADQGPDQRDIDHQLATFEAKLADPEFGDVVLGMATHRILTGLDDRLPLDGAEMLEAMREWTPASMRDALAESQASWTVLHAGPRLLAPAEVGVTLHVRVCSLGPIHGVALRRRWRGSTAPRGVTLVHNEEAVGFQRAGVWHGVRFDDAVGVGLMGDGRLLTGTNGCEIAVDPADFRGAEAVVRRIDERIPAALRYPVEPD